MRGFAALVLVLGGCSELLGLADVESSGVDADRDGVRDSIDNCKGVHNPDQTDRDGDGVGDACDPLDSPCAPGLARNVDYDRDGVDDGCDPCLRGPDVDEDGDGIFDACDLCPGVPDGPAPQSDIDQDSVGDACDPHAGHRNRRVLFDGFARRSPWIPTDWVVDPADGGTLRSSGNLFSTSVNNAAVFGEAWYVQLELDLPASLDGLVAGAELGISMSTIEKNSGAWCGVILTDDATFELRAHPLGVGGGPKGDASPAAKGVGMAPGARVVLTARAIPKENQLACTLTGSDPIMVSWGDALKVRLFSELNFARVRYIDVVR